MANSSFLMEDDVDHGLESEFAIKSKSELSPAERMSIDSDECLEKQELDLFVTAEWTAILSTSEEQREETPGGDGVRQTEGAEIQADRVLVVNKENERLMEEKMANRAEEGMAEDLNPCSVPEEDWGCRHVRISLEEVERFYKFSCRCHWLCGRCCIAECDSKGF